MIVAFLVELAVESQAGMPNDHGVILLVTVGLALVAASAALVLTRRVSLRISIFGTLLIPGALLAHSTITHVGIYGLVRLAATISGAVGFAGFFTWVGGFRWGRVFLFSGATVALVIALSSLRIPAAKVSTAGVPNAHIDVVFIVMDTTRKDHLSIYGYSKPTSPYLEKFAVHSQVYDDAWSVSPWTPPSHASMLTGLLPSEHGADGQVQPRLDDSLVTLQEVLSENQYATAGFVANPNLWVEGWDQGFAVYEGTVIQGSHSVIRLVNAALFHSRDGWDFEQGTPVIFSKARNWWSSHENQSRFLFLNLMDPHRPYKPPPEMHLRFPLGMAVEKALEIDQDPVTYHIKPGVPPREAAALAALYDGEIASMDRHVGLFVDWLSDRGEMDSTLIIVTADHGERLGERGLVGHDLVMDSYLLEVPLLIRLPGKLLPGRIGHRVQLDGLPGYVLEILGISSPAEMARRSFRGGDVDLVVAQYQKPEWFIDRLLARNQSFDVGNYRADWNFVSDGRFAFLAPSQDPDRGILIDMASDRDWAEDVSSRYPDVAEKLRQTSASLPAFREITETPVDENMKRRLRSLGYVD